MEIHWEMAVDLNKICLFLIMIKFKSVVLTLFEVCYIYLSEARKFQFFFSFLIFHQQRRAGDAWTQSTPM